MIEINHYISINILGPRALSLPARRGERALAMPGSGPSVPARRGERPSQCRGLAPPFRPAGADGPSQCRGPAPPKMGASFCLGPPNAAILDDFGALFACPKRIEKRRTLKACQNRKNLASRRPQARF